MALVDVTVTGEDDILNTEQIHDLISAFGSCSYFIVFLLPIPNEISFPAFVSKQLTCLARKSMESEVYEIIILKKNEAIKLYIVPAGWYKLFIFSNIDAPLHQS